MTTVEEAAAFLFVSRTHIRRLIERGVLIEVLPRRLDDNIGVDPVSVRLLSTAQDTAQRAYQNSQIEDTDPLGL